MDSNSTPDSLVYGSIPIEEFYARIRSAVPEVVSCKMQLPYKFMLNGEQHISGATSKFAFANGKSLNILHTPTLEPVTHVKADSVEGIIAELRKVAQS